MKPTICLGGPLDGQVLGLPTRGAEFPTRQLLLSQLDDAWHCYQLVPCPDSDETFRLSYLGEVDELPRLAQAGHG